MVKLNMKTLGVAVLLSMISSSRGSESEKCTGLKESWINVIADKEFPVAAGTVLTLSCKTGYQLKGANTVTCTKETEFTFDGRKPKCVIVVWKEHPGTYLSGYSGGVYRYSTLQKAQSECLKRPDCGGITYEFKYQTGSKFTLRKGSDLKGSPNREVSWTPQTENDTTESLPLVNDDVCIERSDGRGFKYRGKTSTTRSGLKCQNWAISFPWYQRVGNVRNSNAADMGLGDHNYCRNANGKKWGTIAPWCYNGDRRLKPDIKWEYCAIPYCENSNIQLTGSAAASHTVLTIRKLTNSATLQSSPTTPPTATGFTPVNRDGSTQLRIRMPEESESSSQTFRFTWWRSDAPASTEPPNRDIVWWRKKAIMTPGQRGCYMTYHMINLIMTALVNLYMIYTIITRLNLRQKPCIIPILAASVIALLNVVSNWGFFIGLYMGNWWIRTYAYNLCGYTEAILGKVTLVHILCFSIVTYEATLAIQFPSTYQRSSKKTFKAITIATIAAVIVILGTLYFYYNWIDTPDLFEGYIRNYGESLGSKKYNRFVNDTESRETFKWYNYWKRCSRVWYSKTWDSYFQIYPGFISCLIGLGVMIYSLIQTHRPGLQRRNFIDAVSGKHNFTPTDLDELRSAAKAVSLTLMLCLISPSIDYTQKALQNVIPNYKSTMRHIFGIVEYQWYEETVRRLAALTAWVPALTSFFLNPIVSQAASGEARNFATPPFERWLSIRFSALKRMPMIRRVAGLFKRKKPNVVSPASSKEVYKKKKYKVESVTGLV